ncbi:DUF6297 family protein [Micromonospora eburnea]|uniref:ABC-2 type transport system permease protein n=1 Tax=Micromonospora eburnea TaxID=227316 RepID=A0A1C6V9V6_9ACTN|nr:DUF6297 family protein [Micromonospora eburnea]SCL63055.1 hypothetical protein GA0070604_4886 [Micromonospora eburnea]
MTARLAGGSGTDELQASAVELRRWVRRRQASAGGAVSMGTVYVGVLAVAMAVALFGPELGRILWPAAPIVDPDPLAVVALIGVGGAGGWLALRRLGPLVISRPDASWLLTAPVRRRGLLLPALVRAVLATAVVGVAVAVVGVGRLAARPIDGAALLGWAALGGAAGMLVALAAVRAQRDPGWGHRWDRPVTALLLGSGASALVAPVAPAPPIAAPSAPILWAAALAAVAAAVLGTAVAVRRLDDLSGRRLREASILVGSYRDAAYTAEPSFLSDLRERRSWRGRSLRSARIRRLPGLPIEAIHDLLVLRRKRRRLGWLTAAALLPAALAGSPGWVLVLALLAGGLSSADTTLAAVRRDSAQPALVRLLGRTGRQVVAARLLAPAFLAAAWSGLALAALGLRSDLPPGPWWALGLAVGPAVAVAALRRARARPIDNSMPLVDTPMGAYPPGPLIWLLTGLDLLVALTLPTVAALLGSTGSTVLGWGWVLAQAAFSALGVAAYLALTTDRTRAAV